MTKRTEGAETDRERRAALTQGLQEKRDLWTENRRFLALWLTGAGSEKRAAYETLLSDLDLEASRFANAFVHTPKNQAAHLAEQHSKTIDALAVSKLTPLSQLNSSQLLTVVSFIMDWDRKMGEPKQLSTLEALRDACGLSGEDVDLQLLREVQVEKIVSACVSECMQVRGIEEVERLVDAPPEGMRSGGGWDMLYTDDRKCMQLAVQLWEATYKNSMDDADAFAEVQKLVTVRPLDQVKLGKAGMDRVHGTGLYLAKWAHHAFPRVVTTHTYAAALMGTAVTSEVLEDLEIRWTAFEVVVPNGLLVVDGLDYSRIRIRVSEGYAEYAGFAEMWLFAPGTRTGTGLNIHHVARPTLADLLVAEMEGSSQLEKAGFLARRLVSGLLLAMQYTNNFQDRKQPKRDHAAREFKREDPKHRVVIVGAPVKVDARPMIARFLNSRRRGVYAPPSVQSYVTGHYKRQVIGVGRSGRKVIHIEGYWRGDENAPILTRPQKVG